MARPQTATDDEIMSAARRVIARRGCDRFTLSEVAEEVGVSRGAIISRFKSTQALKIQLASHIMASNMSFLTSLPVLRSGDGLIHFAAAIGGNLAYFGAMTFKEPALEKLELEHTQRFREAVAARMPKSALPRDAAVILFEAHLGGAIKQWLALKGVSAADYLVARTKDRLTLARISFTKTYTASLASPAEKRTRGKATAQRGRQTRAKSSSRAE